MSKDIEETAKAVKEVAKTSSNAIDAGKDLGGFVSKFISGPLEQGVGILEDKLKYIRWERKVRLIKRAEEYLKQLGHSVSDKTIPLKNAVPLLEYATLEENDNLQDMWARLLVNGTVGSTGKTIERSYIEILGQLSSLEAEILETIYALPFEESRHKGIATEKLPESANISSENPHIKEKEKEPNDNVKLALANLVRLGCLKFTATWGGGEIYTVINPTLIGYKFVSACTL